MAELCNIPSFEGHRLYNTILLCRCLDFCNSSPDLEGAGKDANVETARSMPDTFCRIV